MAYELCNDILFKCENRLGNKKLDYIILEMIVLCIVEGGFKRKDIPFIKIDNVLEYGTEVISNQALIGNWPVNITTFLKSELEDYLEYLEEFYDRDPKSKLFPGYNNVQTVYRHLKYISGLKKPFQTLRKEAMKGFVDMWAIDNGAPFSTAIYLTSINFGTSTREVYDVIRDKIQPAGNKRGQLCQL